MKWISVKDALPEIPKGKYGISVLTVENDPCYYECCPNHKHKGQFVQEGSFGIVNYEKMPMFKGSIYADGEATFMERWGSQCGPTGDRVTHWMYLPEPPLTFDYQFDMSAPEGFDNNFKLFLQEIFK